MPKYKFTWEFDVHDAETPELAAIEAFDALKNEDSTATFLMMEDMNTGESVQLDFDQIKEDYIESGKGITLMDTIRQHIGDTFKK